MAKQIDPVDIKNAIKNGQLEVMVKKVYRLGTNHYFVYIRDTENWDTVLIKSFGASEVE